MAEDEAVEEASDGERQDIGEQEEYKEQSSPNVHTFHPAVAVGVRHSCFDS